MRKIVLSIMSAGTVLLFAPAAQAWPCVVCDENGCPVVYDPCPYPSTGARNAAAFSGTAAIDCFGCGDSAGTAELTVAGDGPTLGAAHADYTVHEGTGTDCVISGAADGTVTGAINVSFNWNRVGAVAQINTSGDLNGSGAAAFVVTGPAGLPCGAHNLTAMVAGEVHAL
jgi:hypothetical protein